MENRYRRLRCKKAAYNSVENTHEMLMEDRKKGYCHFRDSIR